MSERTRMPPFAHFFAVNKFLDSFSGTA